MATIGEITQNSYYRGDPALGGGSWGVIHPDMQAFQRLSDYTFMVKQEEYHNRYNEWKDNAKQVADALKIDWANVRPEHAKLIHDKEDELKKFLTENPDASQKSGTPAFMKFHSLKNELDNLTKAGAARSVEYAAQLKDISTKAPDGKTLEKWTQQLNDKFAKQDINTPMNPFADYQSKPIDWTGPQAVLSRDHIGANFIRTDKYTGLDYGQIESHAAELPWDIDKNQVGYEKFDQLKRMAATYNELIHKGVLSQNDMVERDGNNRFIRFTPKALSDPHYGGILRVMDRWNKGVVDYNAAAGGDPAFQNANSVDPDKELNETDIRKLMAATMMENKVERDYKYYGGADQRNEGSATRALQRDIAGLHWGGSGTGTGGAVSLYGELIGSGEYLKSLNAGEDVGGVYYVPFSKLDVGVKARMTQAVQAEFGFDPVTQQDKAKDIYIGFSGTGDQTQVVVGTKNPQTGGYDTRTLSQRSLDLLDLNSNKLSTPDYKYLPPGAPVPQGASKGKLY